MLDEAGGADGRSISVGEIVHIRYLSSNGSDVRHQDECG